jgi:hypothetical protein
MSSHTPNSYVPSSSSSTPVASSAGTANLLARQLKQMQAAKDLPGISCGLVDDKNVFEWEVMLMISDDCKYYGGISPLRVSLTPRDITRLQSPHEKKKGRTRQSADIYSL